MNSRMTRGTTRHLLLALSVAVFALTTHTYAQQAPMPVPQSSGGGYSIPQMIMNFVNFLYTTVGPPAAVMATLVALPMCGSRHYRKAGLFTLGGVGVFSALPWVTDQMGSLTGWW